MSEEEILDLVGHYGIFFPLPFKYINLKPRHLQAVTQNLLPELMDLQRVLTGPLAHHFLAANRASPSYLYQANHPAMLEVLDYAPTYPVYFVLALFNPDK